MLFSSRIADVAQAVHRRLRRGGCPENIVVYISDRDEPTGPLANVGLCVLARFALLHGYPAGDAVRTIDDQARKGPEVNAQSEQLRRALLTRFGTELTALPPPDHFLLATEAGTHRKVKAIEVTELFRQIAVTKTEYMPYVFFL